MNEQEVKKLYQALLSKGYSTQDLGDEQRFLSKMGDANNRKQLYDWVSSKGNFRIGDFNAYEARLTGGAQQEQPSTSGTQDFTMKESELEGKQEKREAQKPQQPTVNIPSVADMMEEHKKRTAMPPVFQSEVGLDEEGNRVTKPKVENVHVPGTPSPQVSPVYRDFIVLKSHHREFFLAFFFTTCKRYGRKYCKRQNDCCDLRSSHSAIPSH